MSASVGILFSVIVSLSIFVFSFLTFIGRPRVLKPGYAAFTLFWLLMGFVWLATAVADLLSYLRYQELSLTTTYVLQIFVGSSLVACAYFLATFVLNKWHRGMIVGLYVLAYGAFLVTLFAFEVRPRDQSFFSTQNISPDSTLFIFTGMFIPLWLGSVVLFIRAFRGRLVGHEGSRGFFMLSALSFVLLGIAGAPDEMGFVTEWAVTAARLVSLVSAIIAYTATLSLHESKELIV